MTFNSKEKISQRKQLVHSILSIESVVQELHNCRFCTQITNHHQSAQTICKLHDSENITMILQSYLRIRINSNSLRFPWPVRKLAKLTIMYKVSYYATSHAFEHLATTTQGMILHLVKVKRTGYLKKLFKSVKTFDPFKLQTKIHRQENSKLMSLCRL